MTVDSSALTSSGFISFESFMFMLRFVGVIYNIVSVVDLSADVV